MREFLYWAFSIIILANVTPIKILKRKPLWVTPGQKCTVTPPVLGSPEASQHSLLDSSVLEVRNRDLVCSEMCLRRIRSVMSTKIHFRATWDQLVAPGALG